MPEMHPSAAVPGRSPTQPPAPTAEAADAAGIVADEPPAAPRPPATVAPTGVDSADLADQVATRAPAESPIGPPAAEPFAKVVTPPPDPTLTPQAAAAVQAEAQRVVLNMPVDIRSLSLALLALFASIAVLHWASAVFIPLMLSVLLTTSLQPAVQWLYRWHVPRWAGAGILLLSIVGGLGTTAWKLSDGATQLVESLPVAARKVRDAVRTRVSGPSPLDTVQRAAKMRLGAPDASGRRAPEAEPGADHLLEADMVIKALGFDAEDLPSLFGTAELGVSRWGTVLVDGRTLMTSLDGVFAAGDIVRGASLVVWAIRDGRDVAQAMHKWLKARAKTATREKVAA